MEHLRTVGRSVALLCVFGVTVLGCKKQPEERSFPLTEVSAFDTPEELRWFFVLGQGVACQARPDPNVTAYPAFASAAPVFGRIHLPEELHRESRGHWYYFAVDESKGTGQGYDRLYFDLNGDLDLTDDAPVGTCDDPPEGAALSANQYPEQVLFNCLDVNLPFGTEGFRPLEVMPRLVADEAGEHYLDLVTTRAFHGKAAIAGQTYDVWLGHCYRISGWFDRPSTIICLAPDEKTFAPDESSLHPSMEWHRIRGTDYRLSATASGDRLIVTPYRGAYGVLKIPAGMTMRGGLYSGEASISIGGKRDASGRRKAVHSFKAPVGDYDAGFDIYLGDLHFSTSGGARSDRRFRAYTGNPGTPTVRIREDKPFVLDFRGVPEVWFTSPEINHRVARGSELRVQASLVDPKLDMEFTDMEQGRRVVNPPGTRPAAIAALTTAALAGAAILLLLVAYCRRSGRWAVLILAGLVGALALVPPAILYTNALDYRYEAIPPTVTIARLDGEVVATGILPFG